MNYNIRLDRVTIRIDNRIPRIGCAGFERALAGRTRSPFEMTNLCAELCISSQLARALPLMSVPERKIGGVKRRRR